MMMRIVLVIALAAAVLGCSAGVTGNNVVAAFYPVAFAAQQIGGPGLHVGNLTPPGAEPHDIELTPKQVAEVERARLVLYLGRGFQPAVSKAVAERSGDSVDLLAGLPVRDNDPHVWLDPVLFERVARRIGTALLKPADPFVAKLRALDRDYREGLRDCKRHEIVTSHAAWGYLAARYDLKQVAITGLTPEAEPTPQQVKHVVDVVRRTHATTVFFETLVSPRLAETVAREVGAHTAVLDPLEGLTPEEQKKGENYFTVMRRNLDALRKALACR
jgi:zinc transport system substrate-binding protein